MKGSKRLTKDIEQEWLEYDRSFNDEEREITSFKDLETDTVKNEWGRHGEYQLVGNGAQTSWKCGMFMGYKGCLNVDLHAHMTLDGKNHSGNVYVEKTFHSCDKPTCPVCYKKGWAVREAAAIEERILACKNGYVDKNGEKHMGLGEAEHIIASVPVTDYGLPFAKLRAKAIQRMKVRGVIGGVIIFHAFRYRNHYEALQQNTSIGWYWSPHFHVLGFIDGGYRRCRKCTKSTLDCLRCSGFEGRTRREYTKEGGRSGAGGSKTGGWIVKVKGERKTIHGTAWYQLNHCAIVIGTERKCYRKGTKEECTGKARAHATFWFGVCSYTRMKLKKEDRVSRHICPICQHELVALTWVGKGEPKGSEEWWIKHWEESLLDADGQPKWILSPVVQRGWMQESPI